MFQFITIVTTIIGIFTLLDLFIEKNAKAKVAEFVFGFGEVNFAGFESNAIKALLSPLKKNDRLSYKYILFRYSGPIAVILTLAAIVPAFVFKVDGLEPLFDSPVLIVLEYLFYDSTYSIVVLAI